MYTARGQTQQRHPAAHSDEASPEFKASCALFWLPGTTRTGLGLSPYQRPSGPRVDWTSVLEMVPTS